MSVSVRLRNYPLFKNLFWRVEYDYIYAKRRLEALKDVNKLSDSTLHRIAHDKSDPRNKQAIQLLYKKAKDNYQSYKDTDHAPGYKKKAEEYFDKIQNAPKSMDMATLTDKLHDARNKFLETRDPKYRKLFNKIKNQIKQNSK